MINRKEYIKEISHQILQKYWGYDEFRGRQLEVIEHILMGNDALVLFPTGAGKSLCFQVPALIFPHLTIVITPLIALMDDQVASLKSRNIRADAIHSAKSMRDAERVLDNCAWGGIKILYISPEKFNSDVFIDRIKQIEVSMIAIDEAHCISQWGFDFRPSYLKISDNTSHFKNAVIIALTATATPKVALDIKSYGGLENAQTFVSSYKRENIALSLIKTENKYEILKDLVSMQIGTQIIYIRSRNGTRNLAEYLRGAGLNCDYYHAGMPVDKRDKILNDFLSGRTEVVCATNAFGMGLDKADVRAVYHFDLPPSIEEYVQEYGRAGRDGLDSSAIMIINQNDINYLQKYAREKFLEENRIKEVYIQLHKFYKIPVLSGEGMTVPLSLISLGRYMNMKPKSVYNALRILEKNEYIKLFDQRNAQSKVTIRASIGEIRKNDLPKENQKVLLALVRMYEGILEGYCDVNLALLTQYTEIEKINRVDQILEGLKKSNWLEYHKSGPGERLVFMQDRLPHHSFSIDRRSYRLEQENSLKKVNSVLDYVKSDSCRANMLLNYFGQNEEYECGKCDICLKNTSSKTSFSRNRIIQDNLEENLGKTPQ